MPVASLALIASIERINAATYLVHMLSSSLSSASLMMMINAATYLTYLSSSSLSWWWWCSMLLPTSSTYYHHHHHHHHVDVDNDQCCCLLRPPIIIIIITIVDHRLDHHNHIDQSIHIHHWVWLSHLSLPWNGSVLRKVWNLHGLFHFS